MRRKKTPVILQMEVAECGAAALGIILSYYNCHQSLEKLRIECGVSRDGSNAFNILKAAERYGFEANGVQVEDIDSLKEIPLPCILHWEFNHFLVLEKISGKKFYLNDPAFGHRTVTRKEMDSLFTGVALILKKTATFKKGKKFPSAISGLKRRLKGSVKTLTFIGLASFALILPGVLIPGFIKIFIDEILINKQNYWLPSLLAFMAITLFFQVAFSWLKNFYLLKLKISMNVRSSSIFFWHVLKLPYSFFQQRMAGDINERINANERISVLISGKFMEGIIGVISMFFYSSIMFFIDWQLTLIGIFIVLINFLFLVLISKKIANFSQSFLSLRGKLEGVEMGGLQIIQSLKASASENYFFQKWSSHHASVINAWQRIAIYNQSLVIMPSLFFGLLTSIILGFGSWKIMQGQLTLGTLIAFQALLIKFSEPTTTLLGLGNEIQQTKGDIIRLDDVLNNPEDTHITQTKNLSDTDLIKKGSLKLKSISFGHSSLEDPLIKDLTLEINAGSQVSIIGPTGCGKSTLIKLITALYQPWEGEIFIDEKSINKISREEFSKKIALVDQEFFLFSGTIAENLTLWRKNFTEAVLIDALKCACLYDEIIMRGGLHAKVEENGANFSGGQCQRLSIAQALVNKPRLLILDEATSNLDPIMEKNIYENLKKLDATLLIVAHRLSAIRDSDKIIVMEKGKIIEQGNHDTLFKKKSLYSKLVKLE